MRVKLHFSCKHDRNVYTMVQKCYNSYERCIFSTWSIKKAGGRFSFFKIYPAQPCETMEIDD